MNGVNDTQGRLEIYHSGQWGTVCGDEWDYIDATVVCRQLGYFGGEPITNSTRFGEGSGQIWMDNVACDGTEYGLGDCVHNGWSVNDCSHENDAGVICSTGTVTQINPMVR